MINLEILSDTAVVLGIYRDELARGGFSEQAKQLKGLELFSADEATIALSTIERMPTVETLEPIKAQATGMLRRFLSGAQLAA
jgi:hypothetical protein